MIKKIKIELIILTLLIVSIFYSYDADIGVNNFFSEIDYGYGKKYLVQFFIKITNLGNSLWYFLILITILCFSYIFKKIPNYQYLRGLSIFGLCYLFCVGFFTQLLKHIIGRPRPNYTNLEEGVFFNFFSTESIFHSFPSGHTSTIISITLIISMIIPSLKIFFYTCGFLIAASRVVTGAHFFTDILGGTILAIIIFKALNFYFKKSQTEFIKNNYFINGVSTLTKINIIFFTIAILITVGSSIDIYISSLFYFIESKEMTTIYGLKFIFYDYSKSYFLLQSYNTASIIIREILLPSLVVYIFILPIIGKIIPIKKIFFDYEFSYKEIIFVWISGILTLIIIVNGLLKGLWGRSRPNDVLNFGGSELFTPWYKFGDTCLSNCSFVSGDASVGFMILVFYFLTKKNIYCYLAFIFGIFFGIVRIIAGGHFFSDIVFSQIVVTASVFGLFILYKKKYDK